ncbi:MAG: hypothetical protein HZA13_07755 [Nitrospirae bacterium]|nr:hypothetical protein [Nitrospirota bacterium]
MKEIKMPAQSYKDKIIEELKDMPAEDMPKLLDERGITNVIYKDNRK